jgi:hypothetical protein
VREYLTRSASRDEAFVRSCAFLEALFYHVNIALADVESMDPAKEFRLRMTTGQTIKAHNEFRRQFYSDVIGYAQGLENKSKVRYPSPYP